MKNNQNFEYKISDDNGFLPVLPLKKLIIYPGSITPVIVGKNQSLKAIEESVLNNNKFIVCLLEKDGANPEYPLKSDLYKKGTLCLITQILKLPDKKIRVLLKSECKISVTKLISKECIYADYEAYTPELHDTVSDVNEFEVKALFESLISAGKRYFSVQKNGFNINLFNNISYSNDINETINVIIAGLDIDIYEKQKLFSLFDTVKLLKQLIKLMNEKLEYLELKKNIDNQVLKKINKIQKDHFLNEQLKAIYQELGVSSDDQQDIITFKNKIEKLPLSDEARKKANSELHKFTKLSPNSPEYYVIYNYLNWLLELPWDDVNAHKIDIKEAKTILDNDHYGLEKIKDRILEYLAVMQFNVNSKAQILCFVGPPGVGKTSLGKSIAKALKREFVRLSVGGVSDESEIRGHRRTYIGALPGIIIQSLKKTGTKNTLIMIDEIDKLGRDYKGDPASALLEVLDPEQNYSFRDHYLDFGFDLSNVFFIATANNLSTIPSALRDRMEIIQLSSYSEHEKIEICKNHLIPKKDKEFFSENKLKLNFPKDVISHIIRSYTAEAGVRELERQISSVYRKSIKNYLMDKPKSNSIKIRNKYIEEILGMPRFSAKEIINKDQIGVAYGLAWTSIGGEVLAIEVLKYPGNGKLQMTGNIGKVMLESSKAAQSLIKKYHKKWGIATETINKHDLHIHIPEGAVPKDGPSAGITLTMAMISCLADRPFDHSYAMTGEISLTGRVLPIGGLSEKVIAGQRYGFKNILIPELNKKDWVELKTEAKENLNFIFVKDVNDVIDLVLKPSKKTKVKDEKND